MSDDFGIGTCSFCGHSTWPDPDQELDSGKFVYRISRFMVINKIALYF